MGGAYATVKTPSRELMEYGLIALKCSFVEPMTGIEPAYSAWEVGENVLPAPSRVYKSL